MEKNQKTQSLKVLKKSKISNGIIKVLNLISLSYHDKKDILHILENLDESSQKEFINKKFVYGWENNQDIIKSTKNSIQESFLDLEIIFLKLKEKYKNENKRTKRVN